MKRPVERRQAGPQAGGPRLLTPHAKGDPLYRKFRLAHDHGDHLLQSCIMSQEGLEELVELADGAVGA